MIAGVEIENGSRNHDHIPFRDGLSSFDTVYGTCVQNLAI